MSFDLQGFVHEMHKKALYEGGEQLLIEAENNPPKANTALFAKIIAIALAFLKAKANRQDQVLRLITACPQFATTLVVQELQQLFPEQQETSRRMTIQRLGEFPVRLAEYCAEILGIPSAESGGMTPEQVGAAHNLLNLAEILYPTTATRKDTFLHLRKLCEFRFSELPESVDRRTEWSTRPAPTTARPQVEAPRVTPFAEKLSVAISATEEDGDGLMNAEMDRLSRLDPAAIDVAKTAAA